MDQVSVAKYVSAGLLGLSFLLGAPGNLLVIWVIWRQVPRRTHTLWLILHLAAADLLVLVTLPLWIYSLVHSWVFGDVFCKLMVYIIMVCMYSSIFLITLMSVERFVAICYPFAMLTLKTKNIFNVSLVVVWILASILGVPLILVQSIHVQVDEVDGTEQCLSRVYGFYQQVISSCLEVMVGFVVPFTILSICYCLIAIQLRGKHYKGKKKSLILIGSVVVAFALCWLPHHIVNIINLVCIVVEQEGNECVSQSVTLISGALVFISSSVNPILYSFAARRSHSTYQRVSIGQTVPGSDCAHPTTMGNWL